MKFSFIFRYIRYIWKWFIGDWWKPINSIQIVLPSGNYPKITIENPKSGKVEFFEEYSDAVARCRELNIQ